VIPISSVIVDGDAFVAVLSHLTVYTGGFGASFVVHYRDPSYPPLLPENVAVSAVMIRQPAQEASEALATTNQLDLMAAFSGGGTSDLVYWSREPTWGTLDRVSMSIEGAETGWLAIPDSVVVADVPRNLWAAEEEQSRGATVVPEGPDFTRYGPK